MAQNIHKEKILKLLILCKNKQFFREKTMIFEKKTFTLQRIYVEYYFLIDLYRIVISQKRKYLIY